MRFTQGPGPGTMQYVPWDEQRQTLSGSLFPVSCSAADVKEDINWNTGRSCKFWLCPKFSDTCKKKKSPKKWSARTTSGPNLVCQIFFLAKEPN